MSFTTKVATRYAVSGVASVRREQGSFHQKVMAAYKVEAVDWKKLVQKTLLTFIAGLLAQQALSPAKFAKAMEQAGSKTGVKIQVEHKPDPHKNIFEFSSPDGSKAKVEYKDGKADLKVVKDTGDQKFNTFTETVKDTLELDKIKTWEHQQEEKEAQQRGDAPKENAGDWQQELNQIIDHPEALDSDDKVEKAVSSLHKMVKHIHDSGSSGSDTKQLIKQASDTIKNAQQALEPEIPHGADHYKDLLSDKDQKRFDDYHKAFAGDPNLEKLDKAVSAYFDTIKDNPAHQKYLSRFVHTMLHGPVNTPEVKTDSGSESFTGPDKALKSFEEFKSYQVADWDAAALMKQVDHFTDKYPLPEVSEEDSPTKWKASDLWPMFGVKTAILDFMKTPDFKKLPVDQQQKLTDAEHRLFKATFDLSSLGEIGNQQKAMENITKQLGS